MKKTEDIKAKNMNTKTMNAKIYIALGIFLIALVCIQGAVSAQESINVIPDKDTFVCEDFETTNYGSDEGLCVGNYYGGERRRTGLLNFNLPAAPFPDYKIVGINLYLYYYDNLPTSEDDDYIAVHELLEDFSERDATWYERETGINWGTYGALPPSSSNSTVIDSIFLEGGSKNQWKTLTLKGDDADNPVDWDWNEEHKIMLTTSSRYKNSIAYYFYSNQADQYKPYLEILYGNDTTPPVISNLTITDISSIVLSYLIEWQTDEPATSLLNYGTESGNYIYQKSDTAKRTQHSINIDGLTSATTYYFVVSSTDIYGNTAQSDEYTFTTSGEKANHPFLLFENISETPGYQHRTESPWSGWESSIIASANNALLRNFADPNWRMIYHADAARDLGLAYQITKDATYAEKAKEALLNLDVADAPYKVSKVWGLKGYAPAYDWVQPYLDSASDETIRDKLATLADEAYYDLNDGGTNMHYIAFPDHHGQAYPVMGIVGCVLFDYNNPNNLPLSSTPSDWVKVGTDYYFENDLLHDWNRSMFSMGYDPAGVHFLNFDYKCYGLSENLWWLQVYSHFTGNNIFDVYPIAKKAFTAELWDALPNRYQNNYCCGGNIKTYYHKQILNLLDDDYKGYMLNHDEIIESSDILPYSRPFGVDEGDLLYLVYDDYGAVQRKNPPGTSHFDPDSFFQVFRGGWNESDDWLSLVIYNPTHLYAENRNMLHHDQLNVEYYSKGDLLLADGGEDKYVLDRYYGHYAIYHNTVLIEDPDNPYDVGAWSNSRARGMYKGTTFDVTTPAHIESIINTSWMESIVTNTSIENVIGNGWQYAQELSSPINYKRAVIYPYKDYFIIVDRLEGSEPWTYRNVFRPTSLSITPSTGTTETEVGHVNGNLKIGDTAYDWLPLPYKNEQTLGTTANSIKWSTTNPYGNDVELHLFSAPSSEIRVAKHVTRITGYNLESEVFLPLVYFRAAEPANDLYRITVLLSRYTTEEEKIPEEIPVTGDGNAVKVTSGTTTDLVYAGSGESSFGGLTTDADILYFRKSGAQASAFTFLRGSYVDEEGNRKVDVSKTVDYLTLKYNGNNRTFNIKGEGTDVKITLYQMNPSITYQVKRDGAIYTNWVMTNGNSKMVITTDLSEHAFEIESTALDTTSPVITNITVTNIISGFASITWQTNESADSLIKYGTASGNYTYQSYDASLVLSHTITLTNLLADTPYYYVVNSTDYSGNSTQSCEYNFNTTTAKGIPETTVVITPAPNEQGWITATPVTISFFRSDDIGIAYTNYSMASQMGPWTTVTGSEEFNVTLTGEGIYTIGYYSVDITGNVEDVKNITVKIDYTAPTITNVTAAHTNSTIITWDTNELSDSSVKYGTSSGSYEFQKYDASLVLSHTITLTNLAADTTYYFVANSTDISGSSMQSSEYNFTTLSLPDTTPAIISDVTATDITYSSATITWDTDKTADSVVKYGIAQGIYTEIESTTSYTTSHSIGLSGLTPNTTYYFVVNSTDASGNSAQSDEYDFTTPSSTPGNNRITINGSELVEDAMLLEAAGDYGDYPYIYIGKYGWRICRGILRFDLSSIPADAEVISAEMVLDERVDFNASLNLHTLENSWKESEVTWKKRTKEDAWDSPGGDYGPMLATKEFNKSGTVIFSSPAIADVVQNWISNPSANYGFLLEADAPDGHHATLSQTEYYENRAPKLVVSYTLKGNDTFEITDVAVSATDNSAIITWSTSETADSLVKYGISPGDYSSEEYDFCYVTTHRITLAELRPNTTYYFVVNSTDASGNSAQSAEYNFITSSSTSAITVTINGSELVGDAMLLEAAGDYGDYPYIYIGKYGWRICRGILRFDLSSIPADAEVISAEMVLDERVDFNASLNLHTLENSWKESEVTWKKRTKEDAWDSPGGDYGPMLATKEFNESGTVIFSSPAIVDVVQNWISNPSANYGFLLEADAPDGHHATLSQTEYYENRAPKLVVTYR